MNGQVERHAIAPARIDASLTRLVFLHRLGGPDGRKRDTQKYDRPDEIHEMAVRVIRAVGAPTR